MLQFRTNSLTIHSPNRLPHSLTKSVPEPGSISAPYDNPTDPMVLRFDDRNPIVIFDGKCMLCSTFAQFVL
jgi:hypothetical protein